jgi:hypothetical protein
LQQIFVLRQNRGANAKRTLFFRFCSNIPGFFPEIIKSAQRWRAKEVIGLTNDTPLPSPRKGLKLNFVDNGSL